MSWESVIICGAVLHHMHGRKLTAPDFPNDSVLALRDLCVIFAPLREATKQLEGNGVKSLWLFFFNVSSMLTSGFGS